MDYKRTCYHTQVRFAPGGPLYDLEWYFCHPKAKPFPGLHMGLSREWYLYRPDIGEVPGAHKKYSKGRNYRNKKGQCFLGLPEWYANGFTTEEIAAAPPQIDECTSCPARGAQLELQSPSPFRTQNINGIGGDTTVPFCIYFEITCPDSSKSVSGQFVSVPDSVLSDLGFPITTSGGDDTLVLGVQPQGPQIFMYFFNQTQQDYSEWDSNCGNPVSFEGTLQYNVGDWFDSGTTIYLHADFVKPYYYFSSKAKISFRANNLRNVVRLKLQCVSLFGTTVIGSPFSPGFAIGFSPTEFPFSPGYSPGFGANYPEFGPGFGPGFGP